jgi:hypothetical protein
MTSNDEILEYIHKIEREGIAAKPTMTPEQAACPLTVGDVPWLMHSIAEGMADTLQALRVKIRQLEAAPRFKYCGVYKSGTQYSVGNFATHAGSLWHANKATQDRPGTSSAWTLAVKSGERK